MHPALSPLPARWLVLPGLLLVAAGSLLVSHNLYQTMDIRLYDESYYLTQGFFQPLAGWKADYSPLYSLWYKLQSLFCADAVGLYYQNYRVMGLAVGLLSAVLALRAGAAPGFAFYLALGFQAAYLNLPLWPKAGHFAALGTGLAMAGLAALPGKKGARLIWLSGMMVLFSWCRPEFLPGGLLAMAAGLWHYRLPRNRQTGMPLWVFLPWAAVFAAGGVWGLPLGESGRAWVAFGQHMVHNYRNLEGIQTPGFLEDWVNWRERMSVLFPGADSPFQALLANPVLILRHLGFNTLYFFYNSLIYCSETLFPKSVFPGSTLFWTGSALLVMEASQGFRGWERFRREAAGVFRSHTTEILSLLMPVLLAGILFQPRPHYLMPAYPLFVVALSRWSRGWGWTSVPGPGRSLAGLLPVVVLFLFLPDSSAFFRIRAGAADEKNYPGGHFEPIVSPGFPLRELVAGLQKEPIPPGTMVFDGSTGALEYLGQKVIRKGKTGFEMNYQEMGHFREFVEREGIQLILLRSTLSYDHFFTRNPGFCELRNHPGRYGWHKKPIGPRGDSLLIHPRLKGL